MNKHLSLRLKARITAAVLVLILVLTGSLGTALAGPVAVGDPKPIPSLSKTSVVMKGTISSVTITVRDANSFTSSVTASWLSKTVSGNKITLTTSINFGTANRYGYLNVTADGRTLKCLITQRPKIRTYTSRYGSEIDSKTVEGYSNSSTIYVSAVGTISSKSTSSWIRTSVSGALVTISVDPNYTGGQRCGVIQISDGVDTKNFLVYQKMYIPSLYNHGYLFGTPQPSNALAQAYRAFYNGFVDSDIERYAPLNGVSLYHVLDKTGTKYIDTPVSTPVTQFFYNLMVAVCNEYGVSIPKEYVIGDINTLHQLGFANVESLYGGYDFQHDCMIINISLIASDGYNAKTIAEAIFHELRHKWQYTKARYNNGRAEYLVHYGALHYTTASDTAQVTEVDARTYAAKMIEELNKKMK